PVMTVLVLFRFLVAEPVVAEPVLADFVMVVLVVAEPAVAVLRVVVLVLAVLVVTGSVTLLGLQVAVINPTEILRFSETRDVRAAHGQARPAWDEGDVIEVAPLPSRSIGVQGDGAL